MNTHRLIRIPMAALLAILITALMFLQLARLVAPMDFAPLLKSVPIDMGRHIKESPPPPPKEQIEKPKPPTAPDIPRGEGLVSEKVSPTRDKTTPYVPPGIGSGVGGILKTIGPVAGPSDQDALPIVRINPLYPARAANLSIQGWVQVRFNITPSGAVSDVQVVAADPRNVFEEVAVNAVSRWRYRPKVVDGVAIERRGFETVLRFELQ